MQGCADGTTVVLSATSSLLVYWLIACDGGEEAVVGAAPASLTIYANGVGLGARQRTHDGIVLEEQQRRWSFNGVLYDVVVQAPLW
jgi:hypothetical protein